MRTTTLKDTRGARRGSVSRNFVQSRVELPESRRGRKRSRRGFAAMDPALQRRIARQGGLTVSRNRKHMARIGRIGGEHSHGARR
jgi:uncharacterized protein